MASRQQIRTGQDEGAAWLLDLVVGAHVYRIADRAVTVTDAAGRSYAYTDGLAPIVWQASDELVSRLQLQIEAGIDWSLVAARGVLLDGCVGTVRRWWPGQALEAADVVLEGRTVEPEYGDEYEPLTVTLERDPLALSGLVLDAYALIDSTTWPDDHLQAGYTRAAVAEGQYYPIPIGYPGNFPALARPLPCVPAWGVSIDDPATTTNTYLIADRAINAATVRLFNTTENASEDRTVSTTTDAKNRIVSIITLDDPSPSALPGAAPGDAMYWGVDTSGTYGGGVLGPEGQVLRGAGDVIEWLLRERSEIRFDAGRLSAAKPWLNRYKVDSYINAQVDGWTWIADTLLPQIPVVVLDGRDGLVLKVVRWDATREEVAWRLSADRGEVEREGRIRGLREPIHNRIEVRFREVIDSDTWASRRILSAFLDLPQYRLSAEDDRTRGSYLCRLSQSVHGERPVVIDLRWSWDDATADQVAWDVAARHAMPKRAVRYRGGAELEAIEPWSVVTITDSAVHLDDALALVQARVTEGDSVALDLILLDQPEATDRATT